MLAYPFKHSLRQEVEGNPDIYGYYTFSLGSGLGCLSPVEGKIADGVKYLDQRVETFCPYLSLWSYGY